VNVNEDMSQNPEVSGEAISLRTVNNGMPVSRETFLAAFCNSVEELWSKTVPELLDLYRAKDIFGVGRRIVVMPKKKEDKSSWYKAEVKGFTAAGNLIVQPIPEPVTLLSEEVTVRPDTDPEAPAPKPASGTAVAGTVAPPKLYGFAGALIASTAAKDQKKQE
jgi:hypothetical protein